LEISDLKELFEKLDEQLITFEDFNKEATKKIEAPITSAKLRKEVKIYQLLAIILFVIGLLSLIYPATHPQPGNGFVCQFSKDALTSICTPQ
jgi:hypothetical protein